MKDEPVGTFGFEPEMWKEYNLGVWTRGRPRIGNLLPGLDNTERIKSRVSGTGVLIHTYHILVKSRPECVNQRLLITWKKPPEELELSLPAYGSRASSGD